MAESVALVNLVTVSLRECGYPDTRIDLVFATIDVDPTDGAITESEFAAAWIKHPTMRTAPGLGKALKEKLGGDSDELFRGLDRNTDGAITKDELQAHMIMCGYQQEDLVAKIFNAVDFDDSGGIDIEEFRKAYISYPSMRGLGRGRVMPSIGGGGACHPMAGPWEAAPARELWEPPAGWTKPTKPVSSWYDKGERLTPPVSSWYDKGIRLTPTGWGDLSAPSSAPTPARKEVTRAHGGQQNEQKVAEKEVQIVAEVVQPLNEEDFQMIWSNSRPSFRNKIRTLVGRPEKQRRVN